MRSKALLDELKSNPRLREQLAILVDETAYSEYEQLCQLTDTRDQILYLLDRGLDLPTIRKKIN